MLALPRSFSVPELASFDSRATRRRRCAPTPARFSGARPLSARHCAAPHCSPPLTHTHPPHPPPPTHSGANTSTQCTWMAPAAPTAFRSSWRPARWAEGGSGLGARHSRALAGAQAAAVLPAGQAGHAQLSRPAASLRACLPCVLLPWFHPTLWPSRVITRRSTPRCGLQVVVKDDSAMQGVCLLSMHSARSVTMRAVRLPSVGRSTRLPVPPARFPPARVRPPPGRAPALRRQLETAAHGCPPCPALPPPPPPQSSSTPPCGPGCTTSPPGTTASRRWTALCRCGGCEP